MKRILITGSNSYIGTSFENYIKRDFNSFYQVDTIDMVDGSWRNKSFNGYDVVYHVAGIAHMNKGKKPPSKLYYAVNVDLAIETAEKAKASGCKQFIFMSSASVYGEGAKIGKQRLITKDTPLSPKNSYGDSKVKAEKGILALANEDFKVAILRPPMIYGKNCKGNYRSLEKFAEKLPIFPYVKNSRSMLYIENLTEFVRLIIDNEDSGIFFPQNKEYTNTSAMVKEIALCHGKKIKLVKGFAWALKIMAFLVPTLNKAFGSFTYDFSMSEYKTEYRKVSLKESIEKTEKII